jgi:hypothetical protein
VGVTGGVLGQLSRCGEGGWRRGQSGPRGWREIDEPKIGAPTIRFKIGLAQCVDGKSAIGGDLRIRDSV